MKSMTIATIVAALVSLAALPALAEGAGGVMQGEQYLDWEYASLADFASADLGLQYVGGFGYSVDRDGHRLGGFGLGFASEPDGSLIRGGVGGVISGQEARVGPFEVAVNLWAGIGGVASDTFYGCPDGYLILFGQADVEAGIAILRWWQISAYAGMQAMASVAPGEPFEGLLFYTPVVGVRVAWGSF